MRNGKTSYRPLSLRRGAKMKVGLVGAMAEEIDLLRGDLQLSDAVVVGDREYSMGKLYDKNVVLVFSRWGKVASASTVTTLINKYQVDVVIFTGVAGAAADDLEIGDIVIADALVQHDLDASALPMFERFEVPLLGVSIFNVEESYVRLARESATQFVATTLSEDVDSQLLREFRIDRPKVVTGTIASGDQFIVDRAKVAGLRSSIHNLKCIEMEGAAVAQVCYENRIPFVVSRVISDKADHKAVIDFPRFVKLVASPMSRGIVRELVRNL